MSMREKSIDAHKTHREYIKFKMKQIKKEKKRGNTAAVNRHATELLQYLNTGESETPIDNMVEETGIFPQESRE